MNRKPAFKTLNKTFVMTQNSSLQPFATRCHILGTPASSQAAQRGMGKRFAVAYRPSQALQTAQHERVRPVVAMVALVAFLGTQWLMPSLFTLREAQAADARLTATRQKAEQHRQAALDKANKPPLWYVKARQREQRQLQAVKLARAERLGLGGQEIPRGKARPLRLAKNDGASITDLGTVGTTSGAGGEKVGAKSGQGAGRKRRTTKPGEILPSAPLYVPNPSTTTKRLDLSHVPSQSELSASGQMCGALAPAAPADPAKLTLQSDQELKQAGVPDGLAADVPPASPAGQLVKQKKDKIKRLKDMNQDFGVLMQAWNDHDFGKSLPLLRLYVKKFPDSPWTPEALIHLADEAKFAGRANEAQALYVQIMQKTSAVPGQMSFEAHQKAYERWADLYIIQGRFDEARPILADILKNDLHWRRRTWASYWLHKLELFRVNVPATRRAALEMRDCGTKALAVVLNDSGHPQGAKKLAEMVPPREAGFSLLDLQRLAQAQGVLLRGFRARAEQLVNLPMPLLLHNEFRGEPKLKAASAASAMVEVGRKGHQKRETAQAHVHNDLSYKGLNAASHMASVSLAGRNNFHADSSGHFLVVQRIEAGRVHLFNPQDGGHYAMSYDELNREWSGTGLVRSDVPKVQRSLVVAWLSPQEMKRALGTCFVESKVSGLGCNGANKGSKGSCGGGSSGGMTAKSAGEPSISVNRISQNVYIHDTPLWYRPASGPPVDITMSYNSQDASNYNSVFGNKWSFNYGSHLQTNSAGRVTLFMPDGREDNFTPNDTGGYTADPGIFNTLRKPDAAEHPNRYELIFPSGDKAIYDIPVGRVQQNSMLTQLIDRWGQTLTLTYDFLDQNDPTSSIQLTKITDAQGKITRLTYGFFNDSARIIRVTDPFGRVASFSYNQKGSMVEAVDMEGHAFQYTYDTMVNVTQLNTAQGPWNLQTLDYDQTFGQKSVTILDPTQDKAERFLYVGANQQGHTEEYYYTDRRGNTTSFDAQALFGGYSEGDDYGYNNRVVGAQAGVTNVRYPNDDSQTTGYDTDAANTGYAPTNTLLPNSFVGLRGRRVQTAHNEQGQVTKVKEKSPDGQQTAETTLTYASNGLDVTQVTDALSQTVATYTYNDKHQPITMTDGLNHTTSATYTTWGAPLSITNVAGTVTTYNYNTTTKRLNSISRDGVPLSSYTYDTIGRVRKATDAAGVSVTYDYNNLDQLTRATYDDGTHSDIEYVCCGLPGMTTDRSGKKTYYDYDPLKRLIRMQDAQGNSVSYDYDAVGNRIRMVDGKGNITRWNYDNVNRLARKTYADANYEAYAYDRGLLAQKRTARGAVISYGYDGLENLTGIDYPNSPDVGVSYDALHRPTQMLDGMGTTTFDYDVLSRLQSVDGPWSNDTVTYHYDTLGRRDSLQVQGASPVSYGYDSLSRLQSVTSGNATTPGAGTWGYTYIGNTGMLNQVQRPNGTTTSYSYTPLEQLASIQNNTSGGSLISKYAYGYDNRGVRTFGESQVGTDPLQHVNFTYDEINQLKSEVSTEAPQPWLSQSYNYDAMGNRTSFGSSGSHQTQTTSTSTLNKLNQVLSSSTTSGGSTASGAFSYDASGNLSGSSSSNSTSHNEYIYDDSNRLVAVVRVDNQDINEFKSEFVYDGAGRLCISRNYSWTNGAWVEMANSEIRRVYSGLNVIQERDGSNAVKVNYTRSGNIGGVLARSTTGTSGGHFYFHYDGRGNVVQLSDASGATAAKYAYDAFGNTLSSTGAQAEANHYRFSTKEWVSSVGMYEYGFRFYSPGMGRWINRDPIQEAGGRNLYAFVHNDPTNLVDYDGRQAVVGVPVVETVIIVSAGATMCYYYFNPPQIPSWGGGSGEGGSPGAGSGLDLTLPSYGGPSSGISLVMSAELPEGGLQKISPGETDALAEGGEHAHDIKDGSGWGSKGDIYKDKNGDLFVCGKGGKGEPDPVFLNINDFM